MSALPAPTVAMAKLCAISLHHTIGLRWLPVRARSLRPKFSPSVDDLRRDTDARRRERAPWRALYKTQRWQCIRVHQLAVEPLCRMCQAEGRVTPATVCDHIERHHGDPDRFFAGPFQSLCKWHHDSVKQRAERARDGHSPDCSRP